MSASVGGAKNAGVENVVGRMEAENVTRSFDGLGANTNGVLYIENLPITPAPEQVDNPTGVGAFVGVLRSMQFYI